MGYPHQREHYEPLLSMPDYAPAATMSDTTRQLCAAPYLDLGFANAVIREVVEEERKAVPPSYGFDIDPVVRHCMRARRLLLLRYALVTVLLIIGLCLSAPATIVWLGLCAVIAGARSSTVQDLPKPLRVAGIVAAVALVGVLVGVLLLQSVVSSLMSYGGSEFGSPTLSGIGGLMLVVPVVLAAAMAATLYLSRKNVYDILSTELAPGTAASAPPTGSPRVEYRLSTVAKMQRGNICVQDLDPFAGAGFRRHSWSFAVSLKSAHGDGRVTIDSSALNQRVHDAIVGLRDESLRPGERIPNVYVVPYVAADGNRRSDDPLIDPTTRTPRTMASAETVAAIAGSPQGGLRHYLRAVVPATGKEIRTPDGRLVLPAQDSGINVTAFVHLAVEGGMLYTEFVTTVMPQVAPLYQLVDNLRPERVPAQAARHTLVNFLHENLWGPVHLVRVGWDMMRLTSRMTRSARLADEYRFYDYGAHFSVRELAADSSTVNFMQILDRQKYIKLLDRVVNETIIEFLEEEGVDVTDFRNAVTSVSIGSASFVGGMQNFGGVNTNIQHNVAPARARTSGGSGA